FSANAALSITGNVNLIGAPLATGSLTLRGTSGGSLGGTINIGTYGLSKIDAGSWTVVSAFNTWGTTTIAQGTLLLGANNALPPATTLTLGQAGASGALDLAGYNQQIASVATAGSGGTITNSSSSSDSTLTYSSAGSSTFSGVIANGATRNVG